MALSVTMDTPFNTNYTLESARARGMKFTTGRITGAYGGEQESLTIPGLSSAAIVLFPPVSTYVFQYHAYNQRFCALGQSSATSGCFASNTNSFALASFNLAYGGAGQACAGIAFIAFDW